MTAALLLMTHAAMAKFFDSFSSYRQGTNQPNVDTSKFFFEDEPEAPASVDDVHTYTQNDSDGSIDVVHAYSMRNGLFGKPTQARIFWTKLDFSQPDYHRSGHADNLKAASIPIETKI